MTEYTFYEIYEWYVILLRKQFPAQQAILMHEVE